MKKELRNFPIKHVDSKRQILNAFHNCGNIITLLLFLSN